MFDKVLVNVARGAEPRQDGLAEGARTTVDEQVGVVGSDDGAVAGWVRGVDVAGAIQGLKFCKVIAATDGAKRRIVVGHQLAQRGRCALWREKGRHGCAGLEFRLGGV